MHILLVTCRRCHRKFKPAKGASKRYCKYCMAIAKKKESYHDCKYCDTQIPLTKKICYKCSKRTTKTHCEKCKTEFPEPVKYKRFCNECLELKKVEYYTKQNEKRKKEGKKTTIDPKWTKRGTIKSSGTK